MRKDYLREVKKVLRNGGTFYMKGESHTALYAVMWMGHSKRYGRLVWVNYYGQSASPWGDLRWVIRELLHCTPKMFLENYEYDYDD